MRLFYRSVVMAWGITAALALPMAGCQKAADSIGVDKISMDQVESNQVILNVDGMT